MTELEQLIESVGAHSGSGLILAGLAIVAACLAIAIVVSRRLRARLAANEGRRWAFGEAGFDRVAFPLVALALVWVARMGLRYWKLPEIVPVLDIAITLLVALAGIRIAVYVLREVLPSGSFLRGSERTVAWTMWVGVALYVTGLLPDIADALDELAITIGSQRISLLLVLQAAVTVAITLAISLWIARMVEKRVLAAERVQLSTRVVLAKLVNAGAFVLAILVALPLVGIDVTALSVFGGALGVGLGFGLQKIASNYVSGFIILLDRSVSLGDVVTVDGRQGTVRKIASRYTVVRGADGTEAIIPNESLITQTVINHSSSERKAWVKVPVTVAYEADLDAVMEMLVRVGRSHPRALRDQAPVATVLRLGESGVELELGLWTDDPLAGQQIRSDLLRSIIQGLRERGYGIPAPRHEIHLPATPETE